MAHKNINNKEHHINGKEVHPNGKKYSFPFETDKISLLAQSLLKSSSFAILSLDKEGRIEIFNPAAESLLGLTSNDLNKSILLSDFIAEKLGSKENFSPLINKVFQGVEINKDFVLKRKDSSTFTASIKLAPIITSLHETTGILCVIHDTSEETAEKKTNEAKIAESERLLEAINKATCQLLSYSDTKEAINNTLKIIGETSSIDYISIYEDISEGHNLNFFSQRFEWSKGRNETFFDKKENQMLSYKQLGLLRWYKSLSKCQAIRGHVEEFQSLEKEFIKKNKVLSVLIVPIFIADKFWGFIKFDDCTKNKNWTNIEESFVFTLAYSIGAAIARNESEKQLLDSRNYLDHVFNAVPIPIFVKDKSHKWTYLNNAWEEFTGLDNKLLLGKSDFDVFPKEQASIFWEKDEVVFSTGKENINEEIVLNKNNEERKVITRKTLFKNQYGEEFLVGTIYDINDLKEFETQLILSKNYLDGIINAVGNPIFVKDSNHKIILANDAWSNLFGISKQDIIGKTYENFLPIQQAKILQEIDSQVLLSGQENINEEELIDKNGKLIPVITKKTLYKDPLGKKYLVATIMDVSEAKEKELELRNSKNYLKNIINAIPTSVFVKDINHRFILVNEACCLQYGMDREELLGKNDFDIWPNEKAELFWKREDEVYNTHKEIVWEESTLGKNGVQDVLTKKILFTDEYGNDYLVGCQVDITQRKEAERALDKERHLFKELMNNIPDRIIFKDLNGSFIIVNNAKAKRHGYDNPIDLIGKNDFDFISPKDAQNAFEEEQKIIKTGKPLFSKEEKIKAIDGSEGWSVITKLPLRDTNGEIIGTFCIARDISNIKKAEEVIASKSQILNGILSNMPVVVFRIDCQGIFTEIMGAGLKAIGLSQDAIGLSIFDIYRGERDAIKNTLNNGGYLNFIGTGTYNDKIWFHQTFIFEDIGNKGGLIGFALDITEAKLSEKKQKEYAENLERTNKELDQFAHVVSHDLKAPLRAISNLSEWIEEDLGPNLSEDIVSKMTLLRGRVLRLQSLINGILDYSRVSRTKLIYEKVDLDRLVDEVLNLLTIPKNITIIKKCVLPVIISNRLKMEQVFINLISNGIKYHDKPQGTIEIDCKVESGIYEISVKDDGPGIAKEFHEKIFVIFQTLEARDKIESTGVGLTIVKKIIEEQGGSIKVESKIGEGTSFILSIPERSIGNSKIINE